MKTVPKYCVAVTVKVGSCWFVSRTGWSAPGEGFCWWFKWSRKSFFQSCFVKYCNRDLEVAISRVVGEFPTMFTAGSILPRPQAFSGSRRIIVSYRPNARFTSSVACFTSGNERHRRWTGVSKDWCRLSPWLFLARSRRASHFPRHGSVSTLAVDEETALCARGHLSRKADRASHQPRLAFARIVNLLSAECRRSSAICKTWGPPGVAYVAHLLAHPLHTRWAPLEGSTRDIRIISLWRRVCVCPNFRTTWSGTSPRPTPRTGGAPFGGQRRSRSRLGWPGRPSRTRSTSSGTRCSRPTWGSATHWPSCGGKRARPSRCAGWPRTWSPWRSPSPWPSSWPTSSCAPRKATRERRETRGRENKGAWRNIEGKSPASLSHSVSLPPVSGSG